jgi:menaquinone-specific isochorismate synthase
VAARSPLASGARERFVLTDRDRDALRARLELAARRARRSGEATLATITVELHPDVDPSAVACASRRPGEPWFAFEQPRRGGNALAALGAAASLTGPEGADPLAGRTPFARAPVPPEGAEASGRERFALAADRWRRLAASAVGGERAGRGPAEGAGPIAVGGFAFAGGGHTPTWAGFDPCSMLVPEIAVRRAARTDPRSPVGVRMTLAALLAPDDSPPDALGRLERRLDELRERPLPLLDPSPTGRYGVVSAMPPEHYTAAVSRARELIARGELQKIVLAREVQVHAPHAHDPAAVLGVLREAFPECFCFCVGRGDATLIAASPELLVRRDGHRVSTLALAGSTRRSADPAVDDHLGEQLLRDEGYREEHAIVVRRIERTLRAHALWTAAAPEPALVRIANIQHLATPIRAQLAAPVDVLELAGLMHPTPAVGGEPREQAQRLIPALEGLDRGWYAGPVGWTDATGDGELCVALRCALLRDRVAHCYAGNGIVRSSDPQSELAETEIKLQALLPLLAG